MTTQTQEKNRVQWDKAKQEGKQRADRIGEILKAAAAEAFVEIKAGSVELNGMTRQQVAEWLDELKETAEEAEMAEAELRTETEPVATDAESTAMPPTWRDIIFTSLEIVRDRRGDWMQKLVAYWKKEAAKADAEMNREYGDRYGQVKSVFKQIFAWAKTQLAESVKTAEESDAKPVNIEVVDDETETTTARQVELMETPAQEQAAQ